MKRTALRLAAGLLGTVLAAGCGSGVLGSSGAGVAARVGSTTVTTADLSALINRGLADPQFVQAVGDRKADYERQVLTRLITRVLNDEAARRLGVKVTDAQVEARYQEFVKQAGGEKTLQEQAAQNGIATADLRTVIRDFVLSDAISAKLATDVKVTDAQIKAAYEKNIKQYDLVKVAHILVKDEKLAKSILAQLRGGADFAALAKKYSTDPGSKDNGGVYDFAPRGQYVKPFEDAAFGTPPGQLVPAPVKTEFGFHVMKVLARKKTSLAEATAALREQLVTDASKDLLPNYIKTLVKEMGISVNPRFGHWDAETREVVAPANDLSSPAPSASPATS